MKKTNKIILIILIFIVFIIVLATIFGIVDYNRVTNNMRPIFSLSGKNVENQFVNAEYSETKWEKDTIITNVYLGLGYKLIVCNNKENDVYILPLYIGSWTCSYESNVDINISDIELNKINNKITEYFDAGNENNFNLSAHYVDTENNVVIVELLYNSKEDQELFKKYVVDSNHIIFVQGGPYTTSNNK